MGFSPDGRLLAVASPRGIIWLYQLAGASIPRPTPVPTATPTPLPAHTPVPTPTPAPLLEFKFLRSWGALGSGDGQFAGPSGIVVDAAGDVYVADARNQRIQKFSADGPFLLKWGTLGLADGQFQFPVRVAVGSDGKVYVTDLRNHRVQVFDTNGRFLTKWGFLGGGDGFFQSPGGIAVDSATNVYVADTGNDRVQKFSEDGRFLTKWGSEGRGDGQLNGPNGIAVDGARNVYVADTSNHRVQKFTADGRFLQKWGSKGNRDGQFEFPSGITVDGGGNIYVVDRGNSRVQVFDSSGRFLAKWGSKGSGNGQFEFPSGITVDGAGNVYIADWNNYRVQVFAPVQPPSTTSSTTASRYRLFINGVQAPAQNRLMFVAAGTVTLSQAPKPDGTYAANTSVTMAATGPPGYQIVWSGVDKQDGAFGTVQMNADRYATLEMRPPAPTPIPTPTPAPKINLVPNPSFENGSGSQPDGWVPNPNGVFDATFVRDTTFGRTGSSSVKISTSEGNASVPLANPGWKISGFIPIEQSQNYRASVFTYTPDGGVGHIPAIQFFKDDGTFLGTIGATGPSRFTDPIGVWLEKTYSFTPSNFPTFASATKVKLILVQDIGSTKGTLTTVFFDDVVLRVQ